MGNVREIFADLAAEKWPFTPIPTWLRGTWRIELEDDGTVHLRFADGAVRVSESRDDADCAIAMTADDFIAMAEGGAHMIPLYLQTRVRVQGSVKLAELLHSYLRAVEQRRRDAAGAAAPQGGRP
jgi:hypothetical protein